MIDKKGWALLISTPRGKGWFYELFRRGQGLDPDYQSWNHPTWTNPYVSRELIEEAPRLAPDAIVLDVSMPRLNGLDAARQLGTLLPDTVLVVVTMHKDAQVAADARQAGVAGFVTKSAAASELKAALAAVLDGDTYLTPLIPQDRVDELIRHATSRDSCRWPCRGSSGGGTSRYRRRVGTLA